MKFLFKIVVFFCVCTYGQKEHLFKSYEFKNQDLRINTNSGYYILKGISPFCIETAFIPNGEANSWKSHIDTNSITSTKKFSFSENKTQLSFTSKGITAIITKKPFSIVYYYKNKLLIKERKGYIKKDTTEVLDFSLSPKEVLYGGGSRALPMNRRGYKLPLYHKASYAYETEAIQMNYCLPIVISSKNYLLHFDNPQTGYLDLDSAKDNSLQYETIGGAKKYQIIAGNTWENTISAYTKLTGNQPIPPRWALGNFASRFGYHSQKEVKNVVTKFKKDNIPLDAVILDIFWFGKDIKDEMGGLHFYKDSFPTPQKMITDFKKQNIKTVLITEPFILKTSGRWEEALKNKILATDSLGVPYTYDFYFGNTGLIDIFKPKAKKWFQNIYATYTKMGIAGWWGDLGEPEVHPHNLFHGIKKANEVHNIYGHQWAKSIFELYQKNFPNQRPFILMRAGYSGSQAYGLIPWSGDVKRSWGGLQAQPKIALQMGMQGLAYMHSDLGGFAEGKVFDSELYTRWLQYGVFQPIFRPHAQEHIAPEPVFHDPKTKLLAKKAIDLRYNLLPYNYTLAFENNQKGTPLMRPLFFEEPQHKMLQTYSESYLWGNDFLISPVLQPKVTSQKVYFPKGNCWYDFYTGKKHLGGQTKKITVTKEYIPTFVRGGAFITTSKGLQNTEDFSTSNLEVDYYFCEHTPKSESYIYIDDGKTPESYENKQFEKLIYTSNLKKNKLLITIKNTIGANYTTKEKKLNLVVRHWKGTPKKLIINHKKVGFNWDAVTKKISFFTLIKPNKTLKIELTK